MHIHHTKMKMAAGMGCHLSISEGRFRIFCPERNITIFAHSANEALELMRLEKEKEERVKETTHDDNYIGGVHRNGGIAYREGAPAADCPFLEDSPEFDQWNDEWDEAADEAEAEEKPQKSGSVVTNRYRANYSESGHPTHCGDELAVLLNGICLNKAGINMELFEEICKYNGVDLSKYKRTGKGWQGRLRMTGRNLLASKVRDNKGTLMMPEGLGEDSYQLSQEWVEQAGVKYKPRAPQA